MLDKIRQLHREYQPTYYTQGFLTAMLMIEAVKRTLDAKKDLFERSDASPVSAASGLGCGTIVVIAIVIIVLLIILSTCSSSSTPVIAPALPPE